MGVVLPTSGVMGFQARLAEYFHRKSETHRVHVVADESTIFYLSRQKDATMGRASLLESLTCGIIVNPRDLHV